MIAPDLETGIARLRELVDRARVVVPFTGAGISTECGIPDFRSPGGLWTRLRPIEFSDFLASQDMCATKAGGGASPWRSSSELRRPAEATGRWPRCTLASLYKAGKVPGIVTQNIDNLHQMSGFAADDVIELHGNTTYATCIDCRKRYELSWVKHSLAQSGGRSPECTVCDGYIKTATVSFGQAMPELAMQRARALTERCDLFVAIGSSLVVWPAAGFPLTAKRNGAKLAIINREDTEFDEIADLVVHDDIGATLSAFITQ